MLKKNKYIAMYQSYKQRYAVYYHNKDCAIRMLQNGSDWGYLMPMMVIDSNTKEIVWREKFIHLAHLKAELKDFPSPDWEVSDNLFDD